MVKVGRALTSLACRALGLAVFCSNLVYPSESVLLFVAAKDCSQVAVGWREEQEEGLQGRCWHGRYVDKAHSSYLLLFASSYKEALNPMQV
jgi:hypothetical protein